jgi:hypothetical protein
VEYEKSCKKAHEQMNVIDRFTQGEKVLEEDLRKLNGGSSRVTEPARILRKLRLVAERAGENHLVMMMVIILTHINMHHTTPTITETKPACTLRT